MKVEWFRIREVLQGYGLGCSGMRVDEDGFLGAVVASWL